MLMIYTCMICGEDHHLKLGWNECTPKGSTVSYRFFLCKCGKQVEHLNQWCYCEGK